jgi:WD40 repeat protein
LAFDLGSMGYALSSELVQMPPTGLQRKHICGLVRGDFLLTGTLAGDMCVFSLKTKVFRTALPLCSSGLTSLAAAGSFLYAAGGDGRVKTLTGDDTHWDCQAENILEIGVTSLTPSADAQELVAATRNGKMWRLLCSDLTFTLQAVSHTGEVSDVAFGGSSDHVLTCSEAGEVLMIDLSDYMPITSASAKSPARSVVMTPAGEILAGYADGSLRAWSAARSEAGAELLWSLSCHRDAICVVKASPDFIVTGSSDCSMRFWHTTSHSLLTSFTNHRKPVADAIVDEDQPHLVHSASQDRQVVTYDLKQNKPAVQHFTRGSSFTGLSQRKDRDRETVTCSLDGKIMFWDVDYADPTGCIEPPPGAVQRLTCVAVSPSGRYIAAGSEEAKLNIYDLVDCTLIQECEGHLGSINKVRWSPDQKQIITAGKDGCVIIWNFFEM